MDVAVNALDQIFVVGNTANLPTGSPGSHGWFTRVGSSGDAQINLALLPNVSDLQAVRPTPGGSLLLLQRSTTSGAIPVRANTAGVADPNFTVNLGTAKVFRHTPRYQTTGAIIFVTGTDTFTATGLTRADAQGALDTTFGTGGTALFGSTLSNVSSLNVDSSDRIYVSGAVGGSLAVARYSADGQLDSSFGTNGVLLVGVTVGTSPPPLIASRSGNDLYFIYSYKPSSGYDRLAVMHLTPAGLDASYAAGTGFASLPSPYSQEAFYRGIGAVMDDGTLLLAADGTFHWSVGRLNRSGALDTTYGTNGWTSAERRPLSGGGATFSPALVTLANDSSAIVVQKRVYTNNAYAETSAIVCRYRP